MSRYAIISPDEIISGVQWYKVDNVIVNNDTGLANLNGWKFCPEIVEPGWRFDGVGFHPQLPVPPPVPQTVSQTQFRIALHRMGMLQTVQDMIDAAVADDNNEEFDGVEILLRWNAPTIERFSPMLNQFADLLQLTQEQRDDIFRLAATL